MNPKAGWSRDPSGRAWSRYWDGDRWREWVDGTEDREDPLGEHDLEPPGTDERRLTLVAAHPRPAVPTTAQVQHRADRRRWIRSGCALAVLWTVGGTAILILAVLAGTANPMSCADAGINCDSNNDAVLVVLLIGLGLLIAITAYVVAWNVAKPADDDTRSSGSG